MAHFTQLGLSGKPEGKASPQTAHAEKRPRFSNQHKTAVLVAVVAISSILGIFLLESGPCGRNPQPGTSFCRTAAGEKEIAPAQSDRCHLQQSGLRSLVPLSAV